MVGQSSRSCQCRLLTLGLTLEWMNVHALTLPRTEHFLCCLPADNANYPNPPGWGISYHLNGEESPVLKVQRGTTYAFKGKVQPARASEYLASIRGSALPALLPACPSLGSPPFSGHLPQAALKQIG